MPPFPGTPGDDILYGTDEADDMDGFAGNDRLFGFGGDDALDGGDGSDILDGGTGADGMAGGPGDDYFVVDNAGDVVTEEGASGFDLVFTTIDYTLPGQVERLAVFDASSITPLTLTGNALNNEIIGNDGANYIDGGAGADSLKGGGGDDQYVVSIQGTTSIGYQPPNSQLGALGYQYLFTSQPDLVHDHAGGGTDTIWVPFTGSTSFHSWFDYTLIRGATLATQSNIERLGVLDPTSTYAVNLQGDRQSEVIMGNDGQNLLDGYTGADTMVGYGGDDIYLVDNTDDVVIEEASDGFDTVYAFGSLNYILGANVERVVSPYGDGNTLTGNGLDNEVTGGSGANTIDGKLGNDILQGGSAIDTFVFSTALGADNVDQIVDFSAGFEKIHLDDAVFTGLTPGALPDSAFQRGTTVWQAQDADDRILYDSSTGKLYFDPDGTGATDPILFAIVHEGMNVTANDFIVI